MTKIKLKIKFRVSNTATEEIGYQTQYKGITVMVDQRFYSYILRGLQTLTSPTGCELAKIAAENNLSASGNINLSNLLLPHTDDRTMIGYFIEVDDEGHKASLKWSTSKGIEIVNEIGKMIAAPSYEMTYITPEEGTKLISVLENV